MASLSPLACVAVGGGVVLVCVGVFARWRGGCGGVVVVVVDGGGVQWRFDGIVV